jgi:hypothetical protein
MLFNILFYGNCQLFAVLRTLNLPQNYNIFDVKCCHDDIDKIQFTDTIKKCDIIITQSICDNYRNVEYLSTSYIQQHKKQDCKLILFDSCYFNFYYFDLTYKMFNNDVLHKPEDYHYNKMIECYNNGMSVEYYITHFVNNVNLKSSEELEKIAEDSLNELKNRYINNKKNYNDAYIISIYEYIKQNYKNKLLFYSMNHPSKYVIQYICEQICDILQIQNTINYDIDILSNPKCILYKSISKNVNFDINTYSLTLNHNHTIAQLYYDTYKEIGFK